MIEQEDLDWKGPYCFKENSLRPKEEGIGLKGRLVFKKRLMYNVKEKEFERAWLKGKTCVSKEGFVLVKIGLPKTGVVELSN